MGRGRSRTSRRFRSAPPPAEPRRANVAPRGGCERHPPGAFHLSVLPPTSHKPARGAQDGLAPFRRRGN